MIKRVNLKEDIKLHPELSEDYVENKKFDGLKLKKQHQKLA